jgi:hypothetical protein
MNKTTFAFLGLLLAPLFEAHAAIVYDSPGSVYFQDFDSLPNTPENTNIQTGGLMWTDDTASPAAGQFSILGWYLYHPATLSEGGFSGHQRVRIGAGTTNTGAFWSFGMSGSTERALGGIASNILVPTVGDEMYLGFRLTNQSGVTLDQFTLSYNGEQWRDGGSATPNAQSLTFMWSTTATAISDPSSSFSLVPTLDFTSPVFVNPTGGAAVNGDLEGRVAISAVTVTGINWLPGTDLWLRWADMNNSGNDHGLGIDDVSFSAMVPEPGSFGMIGIVLVVFSQRRRRN